MDYNKFNVRTTYGSYTNEECLKYNGEEDFYAKYPHTRIRGKKVPEDKIIPMLALTDQFFAQHNYNHFNSKVPNVVKFKRLDVEYFDNQYFARGLGGGSFGFLHKDGAIGLNFWIDRYANAKILVEEALELVREFPFLDMMIAVSSWCQYPPMYSEADYDTPDNVDWGSYLDRKLWESADFTEFITHCIHIKDGKVYECVGKDAQEMYRDYGAKDEDRFFNDYNMYNQIVEFGEDDFKKCFEFLGVDFEAYNNRYLDARHVKNEYSIESHATTLNIMHYDAEAYRETLSDEEQAKASSVASGSKSD